ncbi:UPF0561 protein C2orf68 homolog [Pollicipes pollicipes]|uniref:UPF0561 protein C2orf68 homolog n=1 Tax=Pollicipes pollicipes TaxID=41117 RepID=UPI001884946A|nr:UPF0561 protein C2orf68 homolog [Pollicipes pollicipes]XP_037094093.1 UPF0561 protein C2orf68 homolog [Pollicipes pollicipes]XP_037094094.1 UPF0561 protein C2orf68 homolog [Pollicipes pollicipes]XP_037094095.1 UPF0561 protein C2orf68 homolog [Pollicipes pollicipes]
MDGSPKCGKDVHLDMNHGFIKSIIKNQLDRDSYDKELKEKQAKARAAPAPADAVRPARAAPRRPDRAIYTPPAGGPAARRPLFMLEYADTRTGAVRRQPFMDDTDLSEFCADFSQKAGLDERLQRALYHRLLQELPDGRPRAEPADERRPPAE